MPIMVKGGNVRGVKKATSYHGIYSRLGEETSGNHQAYGRGHLNITILNKIRAAKECGRNYFNK